MARDDAKFLTLSRDRCQQGSDAEEKQRARELSDLRFYAGDQWDPLTRQARSGQPANATNGLPPVPARPTLVINKVREPVRQVLNGERGSEFGLELVAADDFGELAPADDANAKEIELREGLVRRIQRSSEAADARSWAFERAVIAGRGFYGVMTRYLPGKTWDQELYIERYYNQAAVLLDPAHEQPDGSDADWGFVGRDMPWADYKAEFPRNAKGGQNALVSYTDDQFRALGDEMPGWFTSEGETKSCRVVNYWYIEREPRELALMPDGTSFWADEVPEGMKPASTRTVIERQIKWAKIDGKQILDETDWQGPDLPIIKILGEELQPYDNERRVEGMVRPARDAQEGFNAMVSKWVETVGLAPIPPFLVAEGTVDDYKAWYQAAATRAIPYLPYKPYDLTNQPAPPPTRPNALDGTFISAISGSVGMFAEAIQSTTGVPDTALGKTDPSVTSGRQSRLLVQQAQQGTNHYLDNFKRSLRYEGQIVNNLLYPIYGTRPGRLARIVNGQGEAETVVIGQPNQPGAPMPTQATGVPPMGGPPMAPPSPPYQLTKDANFNVVVKVSRAFDTRREQEADFVAQLMQSKPEFVTWFGDLFFKNQDGPGHKEMAERAKVMLAPPIQELLASTEQGQQSVPPPVKAQMQAMKKQLDDANALLQKFAAEQQSNQAELDNKLEIERVAASKDIELQRMRDATSIAVAKINLMAKGIIAQGEIEAEQLALHTELAHGHAEAALDRAHAQTQQPPMPGPNGQPPEQAPLPEGQE
jgi:hypothetical protein